MKDKDDDVYLNHIAECIRRIEENVKAGKAEFMKSHTLQDAVLRNLQTMSEATQRLSETLKTAHPETEWANVAAFRNVLVHNYLGIDLEIVWKVIGRDVPKLKSTLELILGENK